VSFASPWLLLCLLAVPAAVAAYLILERRRARQAEAWSSSALLANMVPGRPGRRRLIPVTLFLIGLTLLLAGFARPQANINVPKEGATVVLAIDVSGSMEATDVKPTRVQAARAAATEFLQKLPKKYRASLVTFSDHSTVKVAPTYEHDKVIAALPTKAQAEGTALGEGIAASVLVAQRAIGKPQAGKERVPAAILLLSDGSQTSKGLDPAQAAGRAKKIGVPISTVALGTARGMLVRKLAQPGQTERIPVPPAPNALKALAQQTQGTFFQAHSADQLKKVYEDLGHRLLKQRERREVTVVATGAALAFMLVGAALSGVWFRRLV
jgi:Ca-activated chloride channel family protein